MRGKAKNPHRTPSKDFEGMHLHRIMPENIGQGKTRRRKYPPY